MKLQIASLLLLVSISCTAQPRARECISALEQFNMISTSMSVSELSMASDTLSSCLAAYRFSKPTTLKMTAAISQSGLFTANLLLQAANDLKASELAAKESAYLQAIQKQDATIKTLAAQYNSLLELHRMALLQHSITENSLADSLKAAQSRPTVIRPVINVQPDYSQPAIRTVTAPSTGPINCTSQTYSGITYTNCF